MASPTRISITPNIPLEFNSNIIIDNVSYHVQTENMAKLRKIITHIYMNGEIVFSKMSDYSHLAKLKNFESKRDALMESQHKTAIAVFIKEQAQKQKLKPEFFNEVRQLLKRGNGKSAMDILEKALAKFPSDPFLLSYYGCLVAVVENKPKEGIRICRDAIRRLDGSMPFGSEFFYPAFYLNLGRAYLKDGNRKEAISAFAEGLKTDPQNRDILWEMQKLGKRKRPAVPFLRRENPVNKYIGILLSKAQK
jgi:tetratricopeptide (TPR) repeat protein